MMILRAKYLSVSLLIGVSILLAYSGVLKSQTDEEIVLPDPVEILGDSLYVQNDSTMDSKDSQARITDLSVETQELLGEYLSLIHI